MASQRQDQSAWRLFPWIVAACMGVVFIANGTLIWSALHTFPGRVAGGGFDLSNRYNGVIARAEQQAALGWQVTAETDANGHPVVLVVDKAQAGLAGARLEGTARRPLGDEQAMTLQFQERGDGRYVADAVLETKGQWELLLSVAATGHEAAVTRRISVR